MSASNATNATVTRFNYPYTLEQRAAAARVHLPYLPVRGITVWVANTRLATEAVYHAERFVANAQTKVGPCRKLQYELNPIVNSAYEHLMYTDGYVMPDSRYQVVVTSDFQTLFQGETCLFCDETVCTPGEEFVMYIPTGNAVCDARAALCRDCVFNHKVTWCDLCSKEYCANRDAARRAVHSRSCASVYHIFPACKYKTVDAGTITRLGSFALMSSGESPEHPTTKSDTEETLKKEFEEWKKRVEDINAKPCSGPRSLLSEEVTLPLPEDLDEPEDIRTPVITPDQSDEEDAACLSHLYSDDYEEKPDPYKTPKLGKRRSVFIEELADAPDNVEWAPRRPKRPRTETTEAPYEPLLQILRDPHHPDHAMAIEVAKEVLEEKRAAAKPVIRDHRDFDFKIIKTRNGVPIDDNNNKKQ